ncbi:MAG: tRNA pseudouridine(54/55) synthase Pus10 [Halobacteriales archaeon]|jgi:tRNA pseudouridine synthase 10
MDVIAVARDALAAGPVCDPCLGRLVADRSFGLTNRERGHSLRVAVALADDADFEPGSDCWVCEGECARYDTWAERAATALRNYAFDTYQVGTTVPPLLEENDRLLREDAGLEPEAGELLKSEFNREVGKRLGESTGTEVDFERPDVVVRCDLAADAVEVQVNAAFVYGRYRKLERYIPQTEWPCRDCNATGRVQGEICAGCDGTGYRYDRSVEGYTAPHVREAMDGEDATFHGAGREDVDARMLGEGRPFVVEVASPRTRRPDVDELEARINEAAEGAVEVQDLRLATYEMVERVKELDASKRYRMNVAFDAPVEAAAFERALDALVGATIHQETPQRVDHRRASKTRTRAVYDAAGELESERSATVEIHGEGGLYVKELVSGDDDRTEPSLAGELGVDATVEALDVLAVTGEDEPFADPDYFRSGVDTDTACTPREECR